MKNPFPPPSASNTPNITQKKFSKNLLTNPQVCVILNMLKGTAGKIRRPVSYRKDKGTPKAKQVA